MAQGETEKETIILGGEDGVVLNLEFTYNSIHVSASGHTVNKVLLETLGEMLVNTASRRGRATISLSSNAIEHVFDVQTPEKQVMEHWALSINDDGSFVLKADTASCSAERIVSVRKKFRRMVQDLEVQYSDPQAFIELINEVQQDPTRLEIQTEPFFKAVRHYLGNKLYVGVSNIWYDNAPPVTENKLHEAIIEAYKQHAEVDLIKPAKESGDIRAQTEAKRALAQAAIKYLAPFMDCVLQDTTFKQGEPVPEERQSQILKLRPYWKAGVTREVMNCDPEQSRGHRH